MKSLKTYFPHIALGIGIIALSLSSLFVRWANAPGPITAFYRMLIASIILFPFFVKYSITHSFEKKYLILPVIAGLFTASDHALWSVSLQNTRIANATLLNNIAPLWVALFAFLFWHESRSKRFWAGLFLSLLGAIIVLGSDFIHDPKLSGGDGLAVISSLFYAGYYLVTQRSRKHFSTLPHVWIVVIVASFGLLIWNIFAGNSFFGYDLTTVSAFFGAALISQIVGYFSISYALGHLPASVVSPTLIAQPVLTALLAIPAAGEALMPIQILGGITVLSGIYLINAY